MIILEKFRPVPVTVNTDCRSAMRASQIAFLNLYVHRKPLNWSKKPPKGLFFRSFVSYSVCIIKSASFSGSVPGLQGSGGEVPGPDYGDGPKDTAGAGVDRAVSAGRTGPDPDAPQKELDYGTGAERPGAVPGRPGFPSSLLHLWVSLYIHTKIPRFIGSANLRFECSLSRIKIHFREFLYDFALKRNKLLDINFRRREGSAGNR